MNNGTNNTIEELRSEFAAAVKVKTAIVGHVRPDGDCISSCLGLYHYLKANYGYEADVYLDVFPEAFRMMPEADVIRQKYQPRIYDVVFALDCADIDRIGAGRDLFDQAKRTVVIDHHISNPVFGDVNYIKGDIGSACEVLFTLFEEEKLTFETAMCLYTGMVHDTGVFQYSNVTPQTMERAAKLISFGVPFTDIIQKTFYEKDFDAARASAFAVSRTERLLNGFLVWSYITLEELNHFHVDSSGVDSVVSELRNIKDADVAVFLYETEPGEYKCSFRSNHIVNVSELAVSFGGGGHVRAAGCSFHQQAPGDIIREIVRRIPKETYAG